MDIHSAIIQYIPVQSTSVIDFWLAWEFFNPVSSQEVDKWQATIPGVLRNAEQFTELVAKTKVADQKLQFYPMQ